MKLFVTSCLLAALSATSTLAEVDTAPTASYPSADPLVTAAPNLEIRQGQIVDPNAALTAQAAADAVTQYGINSQIGPSSAQYVDVVYTQKFSKVPDQWPSAKPGTIGYGDLQKRNVEAMPTVVEEARVVQTERMLQPVILQMVTEVATIPVRRVTSVIVVETITIGRSNWTASNGTVFGSNGTTAASMGFGTLRPLPTATERQLGWS